MQKHDIEAELVSPPDRLHPETWKASVLVKLHPRTRHPGLARILTVSLADMDHARVRDKLTGMALSDSFLEEMLGDPMVRLVMEADGVSEAHLRHPCSGLQKSRSDRNMLESNQVNQRARDNPSIQVAENEGMPSRQEGSPLSRTRPDDGRT